jgi:hypothetical protein
MSGGETRPTSTTNSALNNDFFKSFDTSSLQDRSVTTASRQFSNPLTKTNENNLFLLRDMTRFEAPPSFNNYNTINSMNRNNFAISNNNTYHSSHHPSHHHHDKSYLQSLSTTTTTIQQPEANNNIFKPNVPSSPSINRFKIEKLASDIV